MGIPPKKFSDLTFAELNLSKTSAVIGINPDATIAEGMSVLAANNIHSLPVYSKSSAANKQIAVILSTSDILAYIMSKADDKTFLGRTPKDALNDSIAAMLVRHQHDSADWIWEVDYKDTLYETLCAFSYRGLHRGLITDSNGQIPTTFISQSDLIQYLHKNAECASLSVDMNAPISKTFAVKLAHPRLYTMSIRDAALEGFHKMRIHRVPALPVVDDRNTIVATLSTSDLRGLDANRIQDLALPVLEFLKHDSNIKKVQVVCGTGDSLALVIEQLISNKVHRVWVRAPESDKLPIAVISMSDVLGCFA